MRQVARCGGSIRYFPSDSAPTANQTQMRNTNTCAVAQNLYNWPNSSFLFSFLSSFSSSVTHTHARALEGGGPWSVVIKEDAAVHRAVLLPNAPCAGCDDGPEIHPCVCAAVGPLRRPDVLPCGADRRLSTRSTCDSSPPGELKARPNLPPLPSPPLGSHMCGPHFRHAASSTQRRPGDETQILAIDGVPVNVEHMDVSAG